MTDRVHDEAGRFESKYDPAYCGEVRQYGEDGYSTSAMAAKLKVSRQTLYNWAESHPEFAAALDQGIALAGAWWEDRLRDIARGEDGNATAAIFGVKNRSRDDWRDVSGVELSGVGGKPIETRTTLDVTGLSDEQLAVLASIPTG